MTPDARPLRLFDPFHLSAREQQSLYATVLGHTPGPSAVALAYRTRPEANPPSLFAYAAIVLHRRGRRRVCVRREGQRSEYEVTERRVSLFPAGWEITAGYQEPCEGLLIGLGPKLLADVARPLGVPPVLPPLSCFTDDVLEGICETLWRSNGGTAALTDALARAAVTHVLERYAPPKPTVPLWFRRAEQFVSENLSAPLSVDDLARAAGLSRAHFSRLFKGTCGLSPHAFVQRRRVERARELLRAEPDLSLAEIAAEVGFCDQSHLTARFRALTGLTPAAYRGQDPHARPTG